ncbi:MAG: imidazole glycerol phosphate synthase subunit HisH [Rickettsiales bacterium]
MKVTLVNYGIGNLLSVQRALEHVGATVTVTDNPSDIEQAERLVVPGVGAFSKCMEAIDSRKLKDALITFAQSQKPYLGICVGMQMLMDKSFEFGEHAGLGIIAGDVKKIDVEGERVPFIGWKNITLNGKEGSYYFVHSYQAFPKHTENLLASYKLGNSEVTAAIQKDNVLGVQFHPEKSAENGLDLIRHFLKL